MTTKGKLVQTKHLKPVEPKSDTTSFSLVTYPLDVKSNQNKILRGKDNKPAAFISQKCSI